MVVPPAPKLEEKKEEKKDEKKEDKKTSNSPVILAPTFVTKSSAVSAAGADTTDQSSNVSNSKKVKSADSERAIPVKKAKMEVEENVSNSPPLSKPDGKSILTFSFLF